MLSTFSQNVEGVSTAVQTKLCKELKLPSCSWRSNSYSAYRHDALKLYEWNHRFFFPLEICKLIRWRHCRKLLARFRFHSASGLFWNSDFLLYALWITASFSVSLSLTYQQGTIVSLNSVYSHFHILPSSGIYKL